MDRYNKVYALGLCLLVSCGLYSCSESDTAVSDGRIAIEAHYPGSPLRATASGFEEGDAIGLFVTKYEGEDQSPLQISGNYGNNSKCTLRAGKWEITPPVYWSEGHFDIYAYYPYDEAMRSVDRYRFSVRGDQAAVDQASGMSGYALSDLLYAQSPDVKEQKVVPLSFRHLMSKLTIKLVKGKDYYGDLPKEMTVMVHGTCLTAEVDLATGDLVARPGSISSIKARRVRQTTDEAVYEALIVPQRLEYRVPLVELISKNVSYLYESRFDFRSGVSHTLSIILSDNPDRVSIQIGGEVEGWN